MTSVRTLTLRHLCVAPVIWLLTLLGSGSAHAQLDTRHWLPPLWSVIGNDAGVIDDHWLFVSTPEVSPVDFTIKDGAGNTYTGTVSNSAPVALQIGNLGTTFGPYTAGGWAGTHTAQLVYGTNNLNTSLPDGLVVESVRPVYVSIRQKSGSQGEILASPGRKGLGKEFRALFARDVLSTNTWRGTFISVMATEPGTTTITFDGIKPGIKLFGRADANNDGTTDAFSVTLSQNQSYIVGIQDTSYTGTAPIADLNGTRVTSDKLVAVTSGFFLGGPTPTSGQDAGFDQLVPTDLAGTEYVMIKGNALASSALETVTVVATQDNTNIFTKGSSTPLNPTPLNAGDYYWVNNEYVGDGLYLTASKPVLVCQGIGGSDSLATSGANVIPPLGADASNFVNNIPLVNFYGTATVGIVTRTGASVTINGSAPSVSAQPIYGTPDWVTYKITGLTGTVDVESNSAVAVSLINVSGVAGLAGYFSGFPSSKTVDLDNDNTVDGGDNCPDDPNQDQIDDDGDGVGNRCDQCDDDPLKAIPGVCGCGVPDGDFDGDGVVCSDNCPFIANASQTDSDNDGIGDACANDLDNDGTPNAQDGCPTDRRKVAPGQCGCGFAETDSDLDGAANCVDECPLDPNKAAAGACGCGQLETDTDGDSIPDCIDLCGNSHLDAGEACDDGNVFNTDACTTQCQARPVAAADTAIAVEDGSVVIDVQANDPTALVRAVGTVIASAPSHGTAVVGVDGRVTYTPTAHYHGADSFTYKLADDVSQSDAVTVAVTINQSLFAPVAVADAVALAEGDTATTLVGGATSVLANDSDANAGDTLTAVLVTGVAHGDLVLNSDGSFSYHHD
ncbi:MAG: Ig-like domain-containing protein, partial [Myxococcota bacterium]